ncbi:signal recognition particle 9 kDa protein-domain-containing protein [Bisporella sp. PMI_857]|nr:signal recognition particle 9 kDa protein-domain-containing protein [Bisporella sp. PMI_857]
MPYLTTAQSWLDQSTLLIKARPTSTRITTKYTLLHAPKDGKPAEESKEGEARGKPEPPRATLELKTYDPRSGTTLKYRTAKAQEVSRLVQILGRLGGRMAGAEEKEDGADAQGAESQTPAGTGTQTPVPAQVQAGAGGGKGKKKKGKK